MNTLPRPKPALPAVVKTELIYILTTHQVKGSRCACENWDPRHGSHEQHLLDALTPAVAQFAAREVAAAHDQDSEMIRETLSSLAGHTASNLVAGTLEGVDRRIHQAKGRYLSTAGL